MKYLQKIWLSKHKYMAVLDKALVIVTLNDKGEEIRYAIFDKDDKQGVRYEEVEHIL